MRTLTLAPLLVSFSGLVVSCSGSTKHSTEKTREPVAADGGAAAGGDAGLDRNIPTVSGPPRLLEGRYFVDEGAPHPLTCVEDKDCIGDTVPDETGCCVRNSDPYAQTFAWHAWSTKRRLSAECDKTKCPPVPVPSMPQECRLKVKCAAGQCRDTCSEQPEQKQDQGEKQAPQKQQ